MKRALLILIGGLSLGLFAGGAVYFSRTASHRAMMCCDQPEMAWLQHQFNLTDEQFTNVAKLHNVYLQNCAELCARVDATNALVRARFAADGAMTPAVEKLLADAAQLRVECQKQMLGHFLKVSQAMPPEEGRRYLAWMEDSIFSMSHEQAMQPTTETHSHSHGN